MSDLRKIRTTMNPDNEIEVNEAEYLDLIRQGLVIGEDKDTLAKETLKTQKAQGIAPSSAEVVDGNKKESK